MVAFAEEEVDAVVAMAVAVEKTAVVVVVVEVTNIKDTTLTRYLEDRTEVLYQRIKFIVEINTTT